MTWWVGWMEPTIILGPQHSQSINSTVTASCKSCTLSCIIPIIHPLTPTPPPLFLIISVYVYLSTGRLELVLVSVSTHTYRLLTTLPFLYIYPKMSNSKLLHFAIEIQESLIIMASILFLSLPLSNSSH